MRARPVAVLALVVAACSVEATDPAPPVDDDGGAPSRSPDGEAPPDDALAPAVPPAPADAGGAGDAGRLGFFVSSVPAGEGGDLGGLAGADATCQRLAAAVGAEARTWRAYLSTGRGRGDAGSTDGAVVHARDRIGKGPWLNRAGRTVARDVADLHARDVASELLVDERGEPVPHDAAKLRHDVLTGSNAAGLVAPNRTCGNWTSRLAADRAMVGHADSTLTSEGTDRWSAAHVSQGCSAQNLLNTGGEGRIYCFAAD